MGTSMKPIRDKKNPTTHKYFSKIFAAIKDPFRLRYYDFSQRTHSEEQIVRLVRYDQLSGSDDILWSLTDEGMLFYTLRLDETPIERAAILARARLKPSVAERSTRQYTRSNQHSGNWSNI